MIFLLGAHAASTAAVWFKSLQQLYGWLTAEEWIETDPMARLRPPKPTEKPVPVLSDNQLKTLLGACAGKEFADRRDEAIVRLFVDTGMRVSEMCGIATDDLDMRADQLTVRGKGDRLRILPFGTKTGTALERYLRLRGRHKLAGLRWFVARQPRPGSDTVGGDPDAGAPGRPRRARACKPAHVSPYRRLVRDGPGHGR